jgi:hypothetical protein
MMELNLNIKAQCNQGWHTSSFDWDGHRPSLLLNEVNPQRVGPQIYTLSANTTRPALDSEKRSNTWQKEI